MVVGLVRVLIMVYDNMMMLHDLDMEIWISVLAHVE